MIPPADCGRIIFNDLSVSGTAGNATGDVAKDIMGADGGLTPTERRNRIYDMRVQVYSRDTIGVQSPVLTMTGTVIELSVRHRTEKIPEGRREK